LLVCCSRYGCGYVLLQPDGTGGGLLMQSRMQDRVSAAMITVYNCLCMFKTGFVALVPKALQPDDAVVLQVQDTVA
jgi:hypothetical protein